MICLRADSNLSIVEPSRSHRYQLPDPYLSQFFTPFLAHHSRHCSTLSKFPTNWLISMMDPQTLLLVCSHTPMPCPVSNSRNKLSMRRRGRHLLDLTRLRTPMFHFKRTAPAIMIVSRSKNEWDLFFELCTAAKDSRLRVNIIKTCSNGVR